MKVYAKFLNKTLKNEIQQHIKRIKDYTQLSSNISHWDARMVQCMQINVINHTKKIKDKSHYHLKRCRKIIWWKSTTFYNKKAFNILSEVSQTKTNTTWFHLYVEINKVELKETKWINGYQELEYWVNRERLVKEHKLSVKRWVSSSSLMHSMVTIVNNTILYPWQCYETPEMFSPWQKNNKKWNYVKWRCQLTLFW